MSPMLLFPVVGLALVVFGWPLAARRVRPNRWYGLRVPATFADERVWYDANAVTGRDMMILGAVILAVALALPRLGGISIDAYAGVCSALLVMGAVGMGVRGSRVANRLLRERSRDAGG
jgi:SdpI/YfhL protein family